MTTFATIATFTRDMLQTDDTDLPDSLILPFANDATRRIYGLHPDWPHLYAEGTLPMVAGTNAYNLSSLTPSTYAYIESVWDDNGFGISLQEIDYQEATRYFLGSGFTSSNMPTWFSVYGGKIYLYPKPAGTRTLRVGGYRDIVDMVTSADSPDLPTKFHNAVQFGCVALAQGQSEDYEGASYWAQVANQSVAIAMREHFNTITHRPAQLHGRGGPRFMTYNDWIRTQVP